MKILFANIFYNKYKFFLIALVCFIVAYFIQGTKTSDENDLKIAANQLQNKIENAEKELSALVRDSVSVFQYCEDKEFLKADKLLSRKEFTLLIYENDSLVFWNNNNALPFAPFSDYKEGPNFVKLRNGYYEVIKKTYNNKQSKKIVFGLLLLKNEFSINNKYLNHAFNAQFNTGHNISISLENKKGSFFVRSSLADNGFYIYNSGSSRESTPNIFTILFFIIGFVLLLACFDHLSKLVSVRIGPISGMLLLAVLFILIRIPWVTRYYIDDLHLIEIFNPHYYASGLIADSLGDLLINVFLILWLTLFCIKQDIRCKHSSKIMGDILRVITVTGLFIMITLIAVIFKSIVIDSRLSFDVSNFEIINICSLLSILCIAVLLISFYLVASTLSQWLHFGSLNIKLKIYLLLEATFLYITLYFFFIITTGAEWDHLIFFTTLISGTILLITFSYIQINHHILHGYTSYGIWIALFSIFSTFLLNHFVEKKEIDNRYYFAKKLAIEKDPIFEYVFSDITKEIRQDQFVVNYFKEPYIPKNLLDQRLNSVYFIGYLNRYDVKTYTFDQDGCIIKGEFEDEDIDHFTRLIDVFGEPTYDDSLFRVEDYSGDSKYLALLEVKDEKGSKGTIAFELTRRTYRQANVYPELLLEDKIKSTASFDQYDYAIYERGRLVSQSGEFPYRAKNIYSERSNNPFTLINEDNFTHLLFHPFPEKTIIITKQNNPLFKPFSLFSYLFCIYIIFSLIIMLIYSFKRLIKQKAPITGLFRISFQRRILFSMFSIIVFSFVVIGSVTIFYFRSQFDVYHYERLMRKVKAVSAAISYLIITGDESGNAYGLLSLASDESLVSKVSNLSDIHSIDINIFDLNGNIVASSQPRIFERGLIAPKIHPDAYIKLKEQEYTNCVQTEKVGQLEYTSAYVPIHNNKGVSIAYLNLPYFAKEKNLREDIGAFMVSLINVYVLLLIGGGLLVFFISNSITKSLRVIGEKLKEVSLGKKNKPIYLESMDEVGMLVSEYNKMILQLEKSADLLAKSERESAWREMAKQVAHEIKNPLTPMKLSIQHLQQAFLKDETNIKQHAERVTATLIEQIDNLTHIASGFSSFAKMPKPKNENINLNEILKSAVQLFKDIEKITFNVNLPSKAAFIYADKNQMISVFNNFIKNAIQAIPDNKPGEVGISLTEREDLLVVSVSDNGIGIEDEKKDKVFVPNFTTKSSGMGLGLALSKNIIEFSGGNIWFESELNKGTTFFVEIPKLEMKDI